MPCSIKFAERKIAREKTKIKLNAPIKLCKLIAQVSYEDSGFAPLLKEESYKNIAANLIFVKDKQVIKLNEIIRDEDSVKVMLIATGG